ncbi:hypothetical protein L596_030504 [Steinernema carpocapsae]|uniref:Uncharacterized protein n=1 Tax=Steinernema carpocapsae TaxID=34508 RepID=A0A4U5LPM0_STECR|nr:hypothetical protein L596_030504 [Steinernema carpocapsae]
MELREPKGFHNYKIERDLSIFMEATTGKEKRMNSLCRNYHTNVKIQRNDVVAAVVVVDRIINKKPNRKYWNIVVKRVLFTWCLKTRLTMTLRLSKQKESLDPELMRPPKED